MNQDEVVGKIWGKIRFTLLVLGLAMVGMIPVLPQMLFVIYVFCAPLPSEHPRQYPFLHVKNVARSQVYVTGLSVLMLASNYISATYIFQGQAAGTPSATQVSMFVLIAWVCSLCYATLIATPSLNILYKRYKEKHESN